MQQPFGRKTHDKRRQVKLYPYGTIQYQSGAGTITGSFELTGFPFAFPQVQPPVQHHAPVDRAQAPAKPKSQLG